MTSHAFPDLNWMISHNRSSKGTIGEFPRGPHHLRRESQQTAGNIDDFSVAGASSTIIYIRSNRPLNRLLKVEIHQSTHKVHHWATILRFLPTIWFVQNRNEFSNVSGASICKWKLTATQNPDYSVYSVINLTIHTINIPYKSSDYMWNFEISFCFDHSSFSKLKCEL